MKTTAAYWMVAGCLIGAFAFSELPERVQPRPLQHDLKTFPQAIGDWKNLHEVHLSQPEIDVLKPTSYLMRDFGSPGKSMSLLLVYYAKQGVGQTMHSPRNCLPGTWDVVDSTIIDVPVAGRPPVAVTAYRIQKDAERYLVLYWYQIGTRIAATEYGAKLMLVRNTLTGNGAAGLLARIMTPDDDSALAEAKTFAAGAIPAVEHLFN